MSSERGVTDPFQGTIGMRPAFRSPARLVVVGFRMGRGGSFHDPRCLRRHGRRHVAQRTGGSLPGPRRRQTPPAPSSTGDERCAARGTTPVCRGLTARDLCCMATIPRPDRARGGAMHRRCNGRRLLPGEHPSPPTAPVRSPVVRGAARGSSSLAFRIPLRSYRGSLARSRQVLVPVIAVGYLGCYLHPAGSDQECQAGGAARAPAGA